MKHASILPAFLVIAVSVVSAQEAKFGRTSDGRAYRVDSEGNRVIDYIADLEMNVDSLNRQVQGLEDELREKTQIIQQMRDGKVCGTGIRERDLQKNESRYADTDFVWSGGPVDCSKEVSAAEKKVKAQCELNENERRGEITALQERVAILQNERPVIQKEDVPPFDDSRMRNELASAGAEAARLEQEIQTATSRIEQLQDELSAKNSQHALLQTQLASLEKRSTTVKASLAPAAIVRKEENFVQNRERALESVKGNIRTEYNRIQGLIGNRDRMYQAYQGTQHSAVAFGPSPARTSDGRDMNMLKAHLEKAASVREVSAVQSSLREIQRKMNDDIGLMQRLSRER